jgi:hypothetical protein
VGKTLCLFFALSCPRKFDPCRPPHDVFSRQWVAITPSDLKAGAMRASQPRTIRYSAQSKRAAFRDAAERSLPVGGLGSVGDKATSAFADFVLVDMFANFCTGREDPKGAMKIAERQLQRIYRS